MREYERKSSPVTLLCRREELELFHRVLEQKRVDPNKVSEKSSRSLLKRAGVLTDSFPILLAKIGEFWRGSFQKAPHRGLGGLTPIASLFARGSGYHGTLARALHWKQARPTAGFPVHSLHDPGALCIAKGKVHKKYGFGRKASLAMTAGGGVIVAAKSFDRNLYDGNTLPDTLSR